MKKIKLSICIPIYNRRKELIELLNSIKMQITKEIKEDIEVCISDNNSEEVLIEVVREFEKYFKINYWKNEKNIGADQNFLKVINRSSGEYCWYMGSDDIIPKYGIVKILEYIKLYPEIGIFLGNRSECDINMNFIKKKQWLSKNIIKDEIFDFKEVGHLRKYLILSENIGAIFSYLSSIVLKKELWNRIENKDKFVGSFYLHAGVVLEILKNSKLMYIYDSIVLCRGENDSFLENYKQRIFLDFNGYLKLVDIFEDKEIKKEFLLIMKKEHPYKHLIILAALYNLNEEEKNILEKYHYNKLLIKLLFNKFSHKVLKSLYGGYKKVKK